MSRPQYNFHGFGVFPPNLQPYSNPPFGFARYDEANCQQDPYAILDLAKPMDHFHYAPPQQVHKNNSLNNYSHHLHLTPQASSTSSEEKRRRQLSPSISSDESSLQTPNTRTQSVLRVPKFDRTYTDALEDELFDESSSTPSVNSQNSVPCIVPSNLTSLRVNQYPNQLYDLDKNPVTSLSGHVIHPNPTQDHRQLPQLQNPMNVSNPLSANIVFHHWNKPFDHVGDKSDPQALSSAVVAESTRRLQAPDTRTVSPREAFLDYPDNANFQERTLFKQSNSPRSQTTDRPDASSNPRESISSLSNDEEDYNGSSKSQPQLQSVPYPIQEQPSLHYPQSIPSASRSTSASTQRPGVVSADLSVESPNSSGSEYDPTASTSKRTHRSIRKLPSLIKSYPCPDCGKRFDNAKPLQAHRRNVHGKGGGQHSLSAHKFSNTSHRCDWVDPMTGKMCNTVFSRP